VGTDDDEDDEIARTLLLRTDITIREALVGKSAVDIKKFNLFLEAFIPLIVLLDAKGNESKKRQITEVCRLLL
jgi:hypothetical protein